MMAQGMDGNALFQVQLFQHPSKGALNGGLVHGDFGLRTFFSASAQSGKDPGWITVSFPVISQQVKCRLGQWHISIFSTLAAMHMNAHAIFIDVVDLKIKGFLQSEATGIDSGKISFVLRRTDGFKDGLNFIEAQYGRQPLFAFCAYQFQGVPFAFKYVNKKEFDAAVADAQSSRGPFIDVSTVQEIVL